MPRRLSNLRLLHEVATQMAEIDDMNENETNYEYSISNDPSSDNVNENETNHEYPLSNDTSSVVSSMSSSNYDDDDVVSIDERTPFVTKRKLPKTFYCKPCKKRYPFLYKERHMITNLHKQNENTSFTPSTSSASNALVEIPQKSQQPKQIVVKRGRPKRGTRRGLGNKYNKYHCEACDKYIAI